MKTYLSHLNLWPARILHNLVGQSLPLNIPICGIIYNRTVILVGPRPAFINELNLFLRRVL